MTDTPEESPYVADTQMRALFAEVAAVRAEISKISSITRTTYLASSDRIDSAVRWTSVANATAFTALGLVVGMLIGWL